MKKICSLIAILFFINSVYAQKQYLELNSKYPVAKVYQKGMSTVKVKNLVLINDTTLQYSLSESGETQISTDKIRYVAIKKGTRAAAYGAYGGAMGLLSALYGVLSVKNDPTLDDSGVNWGPFIAGFTVGGAALGTVVGLCIPKWKIHYAPDKSTSFLIELTPYSNSNLYGLGLKVKF